MPRTQTTKPETLTVRLGPKTRADAERYAELREMNLSEFVRYCVRLYMDSTPEDPDYVGEEN